MGYVRILPLEPIFKPAFNSVLTDEFKARGWRDQPHVFSEEEELGAKMDFLKDRVGLESDTTFSDCREPKFLRAVE